VHALGHLSALTSRIVALPELPAGLADSAGVLRVLTASRTPAEVVHDSLSMMRHYGSGDPAVVTRFLQVVSDLDYTCQDRGVRVALGEQLTALERQLLHDQADPVETANLVSSTRQLAARIFRELAQG
jgi:uncharacterized membrane protein